MFEFFFAVGVQFKDGLQMERKASQRPPRKRPQLTIFLNSCLFLALVYIRIYRVSGGGNKLLLSVAEDDVILIEQNLRMNQN
jgi:hypothetical protein